ncbi:hypothetical protein EJB05_05976, partial [Eragrostis curvula]
MPPPSKTTPWTPRPRRRCREGDLEAKEALALLAAQRKAERTRKAQEKKRLQALESGTKRKRTAIKKLISSNRLGIAADPSQIEGTQTTQPASGALVPYAAPPSQPATEKRKRKKKGNDEATPIKKANSPTVGTRSKTKAPDSPAMGTRSKKKLLDV